MASIVGSVVAALIVAAIVGLARLRWLYLAVPKLSFYSKLSDGQVVSLTVLNMGFRPEQDIEVHLRPQAKYEILASTRNDVALDTAISKISIPRIPRFERVTVLVLVEGALWDKSWVTSAGSKDTSAKVIDSTEQVATPAQAIAAISGLVLIAMICFQFGTAVGSLTGRTAWDRVYSGYFATQAVVRPSDVSWRGSLGTGEFAKRYSMESLPISTANFTRSGNVVQIEFLATNLLSDFYTLSVEAKSSASDREAVPFDERRVSDIVVFPGDSKRNSVSAFVPLSDSRKLVIIEYRIQYKSDYVTFVQNLRFD